MKPAIKKHLKGKPIFFFICMMVLVLFLSMIMPLSVIAQSANSQSGANSSQDLARPISVGSGDLSGTGADGNLNVPAAGFNINTTIRNNTRACADAVAYNVVGVGTTFAQVAPKPVGKCLQAGDEVLLINMQGILNGYANVGRYEFLKVSSVVGAQVNFTTAKTNYYGMNNDDTKIGIGVNQQRVMLMRVPNYDNVVVSGALTANAWDGLKFGVMIFRVKGTLSGGGTIQMSGKGYRGKTIVSGEQPCGESFAIIGGCYGGGLWGGQHRSADGGGGGYGAVGGSSGGSVGGRAYGARSLNTLYPGSAGGWSGCKDGDTSCISNGAGGSGGGIVYVLANIINFTGSIHSDGLQGVGRGGGGAGGSIRVEAGTISHLTSSAIGGHGNSMGGQGRIAVYYQTSTLSPVSGPANPNADAHKIFLTPPPTPTNPPAPLNWGTGADGNLSVLGGQTFNINTESQTRNCFQGGDAVAYNVIALSNYQAQVSLAPQGDCLKAGDELLLINLQGVSANRYGNTGRYEFLHVASVGGALINFTTTKIGYYGEVGNFDTNIGIGAGQQRVILVRVPNYENVTVNGTLTGSPWDGLKHGLVVFRVRGNLVGVGTISMSARGYRAENDSDSDCGESYDGPGGPCLGAGASGGRQPHKRAGGGGYGTNGATMDGAGGIAYGDAPLAKIYPGSAGGDSMIDTGVNSGGHGGGIVYILASTINFAGKITSDGGSRSGGVAGSGAGGSIRLEAYNIPQLTVSAIGGPGDITMHAAGGDGRIAIYYWNLNGSAYVDSPAAYLKTLNPNPTPTATATATITAIPAGNSWGTGADGVLTVNGSFNINTVVRNNSVRACADAVAYSVTALGPLFAQVSTNPLDGCLKPGDEVLLINMQGINSTYGYSNVGRHEFLYVSSVVGNQVNFIKAKTNHYGINNDDANIGIGVNQQRVMLMRVPNYSTVTVNGTLTGSAWDGQKYGLVVFRVQGSLTGAGTIQMSGLGYRGNVSTTSIPDEQSCGESYAGVGGCHGGGLWGGVHPGDGGGGAYGTNGVTSNGSTGGASYGARSLNLLFPGSAGGWAGNEYTNVGAGGSGGGIVYLFANTINFAGAIKSDGKPAPQRGGGGAGGSIRIEAGIISQMTSSAAGGQGGLNRNVLGGQGRIAVYYQNSGLAPASGPANPLADLHQVPLVPTATPTAPPAPMNWGTGADGTLTIYGGQTFNINLDNQTRTCFQGGDAVAYNVVGLTGMSAQLSSYPIGDCLKAGDELLLINLQGAGYKYVNTGHYEFLRVAGVAGNQVNFTHGKLGYYGDSVNADTNIGIGATQQHVILMRVPNYDKVLVNGTLTGSAWDGLKSGLVVFRVRGMLLGGGIISMSSKGYRGNALFSGEQNCGESYARSSGCLGGGLWGGQHQSSDGGGGGYGTIGTTSNGATGGAVYGGPALNALYSGSAGGWTGCKDNDDSCIDNGAGGSGGGIIYILADTMNFAGTIKSDGAPGALRGGGGAGGSIRVEAAVVSQMKSSAVGNVGGSAHNVLGGQGRIAIYYWNTINNAGLVISPSAYIRALVPYPTATLTPSRTVTRTLTPTHTVTITLTPTLTPTGTVGATNTSTLTPTVTLTPTITSTPVPGATDTATVTSTVTVTRTTIPATITSTPTYTPTATSTAIPNPITFYSIGVEDGWVLESGENTNVGGTATNGSGQFFAGDNAQNYQMRGFLSFDTSVLPDNAVIQSAKLRVKRWSVIGGVDFFTLSSMVFDIAHGTFGTSAALENTDFQATSSANAVATLPLNTVPDVNEWYSVNLNITGRDLINLTNRTQFRMRFSLDDNNNLLANYTKFYSGDYPSGDHPELIISYTVP